MTTFAERFKAARTEAGLSRQDVATHLGITYQSVSEWETKGNVPRHDRLEKLCQLLGVRPAWLATGDGPSAAMKSWFPHEEAIPDGYSVIKEYKLVFRAHPGSGGEQQEEWEEIESDRPYLMPDQFFVQHHTTPERCKRALVLGDSMEPGIMSGDKIIFIEELCPEIGCVHIIDGKVYVISIDNAMKIKRLSTTKNGIRVISDNSFYQPETFTNDECDRIRVYGRVIHLDRSFDM